MKEQIQSDIDELQDIANRLFDLKCNMLKDSNDSSVIELKEAISEILYQRLRLGRYKQLVITEFRLCEDEVDIRDGESLKENES